MTLTFGSVFSGLGGFDLGFERAGMRCVWQVEIDADCQAVLQRHWPEVERYRDITEVRRLPAVDVLCGGFPCQDLSVAGKRAGLAGERSGLFYEFMRVVAENRPDWVVIENVPGLLSSNGGRDMGAVLGTLGKLGYGYAYRVLDAQFFGVPQRRRRVFIVGHPRAERAAQVLFEPESCGGNPPPSREAGERVTDALTVGANQTFGFPGDISEVAVTLRSRQHVAGVNPPGRGGEDDSNLVLAHTLCSRTAKGGDPTTDTYVTGFHLTQDPINDYEMSPALGATSAGMGIVAHTLRAEGHDASEDGTGRGVSLVTAFHEDQRTGAVYENDHTHALSSGGGGKPGQGYQAVRIGASVRRLTPTECERLQAFPDGWTEGLSDSARYRVLGNAVCVNAAEWLGRRILEPSA